MTDTPKTIIVEMTEREVALISPLVGATESGQYTKDEEKMLIAVWQRMKDAQAQPLEITEWTDLHDFDEYEAKANGWPLALISSAVREIQRREAEFRTYYDAQGNEHAEY